MIRVGAADGAGEIRRSEILWLLLILTIAAILRAYKLNAGLWYDEIDTLVSFVRAPFDALVTQYPSLNHHVLFSLEAKLSTLIFGESPWALRLPAAIMGIASIAAAWLLARRLLSRTESLFVALLLAVSYHHIWFSQNARGYTGVLFWAVLAAYFFLEGARKPTVAVWAGYGAAIAAAMYTHLSAAFYFAGHGLVFAFLFLRARLHPARGADAAASGGWPAFGFAVGGVLTLALLAPLIPDMIHTFTGVSGAGESGRESVAEWKSPLWTAAEIARSLIALGPLMAVGLPAALFLMAIGAWDIARRRPLAAALFIAHIPLTVALLLAFSFRIWPRYFFVDAAFLLIFLVRGGDVFARLAARELAKRASVRLDPSAAALGLFFAMAGASLFLVPKNYIHPKQDFAGAAAYVEAERAPGDAVASIGLARYAFTKYYAPHWAAPETKPELEALLPASGRLWVVYAYSAHTNNTLPEMMSYLHTDFELARKFPGTLGDGYIFVYRSKPGAGEKAGGP